MKLFELDKELRILSILTIILIVLPILLVMVNLWIIRSEILMMAILTPLITLQLICILFFIPNVIYKRNFSGHNLVENSSWFTVSLDSVKKSSKKFSQIWIIALIIISIGLYFIMSPIELLVIIPYYVCISWILIYYFTGTVSIYEGDRLSLKTKIKDPYFDDVEIKQNIIIELKKQNIMVEKDKKYTDCIYLPDIYARIGIDVVGFRGRDLILDIKSKAKKSEILKLMNLIERITENNAKYSENWKKKYKMYFEIDGRKDNHLKEKIENNPSWLKEKLQLLYIFDKNYDHSIEKQIYQTKKNRFNNYFIEIQNLYWSNKQDDIFRKYDIIPLNSTDKSNFFINNWDLLKNNKQELKKFGYKHIKSSKIKLNFGTFKCDILIHSETEKCTCVERGNTPGICPICKGSNRLLLGKCNVCDDTKICIWCDGKGEYILEYYSWIEIKSGIKLKDEIKKNGKTRSIKTLEYIKPINFLKNN